MQIAMDFSGKTFSPGNDRHRLTSLYMTVFNLMRDGQWRTYAEIRQVVGRGSEPSISARLRDFRKAENGGYQVDSRYRGAPKDGLWEFRLVL
jgi:hypothetical protein